jgi:hypothetical protein
MGMERVGGGNIWTPDIERGAVAWAIRTLRTYTSHGALEPNDPAIDLQPKSARTVPGSWLIDGECGDTCRSGRFEIECIHHDPGSAAVCSTGAHGGDGGGEWAR